jgi:hypothetical protein
VVTALGKGIGATGAHELAHQGGLNFILDIPCDTCYDSHTADARAHFFDTLHWSSDAKTKMEKALARYKK